MVNCRTPAVTSHGRPWKAGAISATHYAHPLARAVSADDGRSSGSHRGCSLCGGVLRRHHGPFRTGPRATAEARARLRLLVAACNPVQPRDAAVLSGLWIV